MRPGALLVPVLIVGAIAGTVWMFGSRGPASDDPALHGSWESDELLLRLDEDGRYAMLVHGTAAGAGVECGRWRALHGTFVMRVESSPSSVSLALMKEPRLRLGNYAREGERFAAELKEGTGATSAWVLTRATEKTDSALECGR